jgi:hypothetical protein
VTEKQNWETPRLESIDVEKKTGAKIPSIVEFITSFGPS